MDIIIVDSNKSFRDMLENFIISELKYNVVGSYNSVRELLRRKKRPRSETILLNIKKPGVNGYENSCRKLGVFGKLNIIALTRQPEIVYLKWLITAGYKACVYKFNIVEHLDVALRSVNEGKFFYADENEFYD